MVGHGVDLGGPKCSGVCSVTSRISVGKHVMLADKKCSWNESGTHELHQVEPLGKPQQGYCVNTVVEVGSGNEWADRRAEVQGDREEIKIFQLENAKLPAAHVKRKKEREERRKNRGHCRRKIGK